MHPAEAILDAVFAAVEAKIGNNGDVFLHRAQSISEAETPCICVNFGSDTPDELGESLDLIGSSLEVLLTAHAVESSEVDCKAALLKLRAIGHRAIAALNQGGVWFAQYAGADPPELTQPDGTVGELITRWSVHYTMPPDDPEV